MKEGWVSKKLGDVVTLLNGRAYKQTELLSVGKTPVLRVGNFFTSTNWYYSDLELEPSKYCDDGDLLFAWSASFGPKIWNGGKVIYHYHIWKIELSSIIDKKYLYYWLLSESRKIKDDGFGTTMTHTTKGEMEQKEIPLPPLSEQKKIASVLDEVCARLDKAKANVEKNLKNLEELFQSRLNEIFSGNRENWIQSTIDNECELMTGGTPSKSHEEYFKDGRINWLVSGDIHKKIITECDGKITEEGLENSNAKYLPLNSVMIALNGQGKTRGTVALLKIKATCNQSLVSIYPKDDSKLLPEYIYENLNSRYKELRKLTSDDDNDRRGLNMPILRKIKLSYPKDIDEQKKIVSSLQQYTAQLNKLSEIYLCRIASLEELRKSILEKAFRGELI